MAAREITDNDDPHAWAADVVARTTGEPVPKGLLEEVLAKQAARKGKNPAAVALGRLGGAKGGRARAEALTPKQRSEIAKKAAAKRWAAKREAEIVALVADGKTNRQIATSLGISTETVKQLQKKLRESALGRRTPSGVSI